MLVNNLKKYFKLTLRFSYGAINVGTNILVKIPDVDKPKIGLRNFLAVVLEFNEAGFYRLALK